MNEDTANKLTSLIKLDVDAVEAYQEALKKIENPSIHQRVGQFMNDHQRHIKRLSDLLRLAGEEVPEQKKDIKGFFIKGMTSFRSITGEEGALKAMQTNEQLTNKTYKEAFEDWDLDPDARIIVSDNYEDEKRHLTYINEVIETRSWEKHYQP